MADTADTSGSVARQVRACLERVRHQLERAAGELRGAPPTVDCTVTSRAVGASTDFQGHDVRLEVTLQDGEDLVLSVTAAYLTSAPRLDASVEWGHGTPVARTWPAQPSALHWPLASVDTLAQLEQDLPRLVDALGRALVRGRRPG